MNTVKSTCNVSEDTDFVDNTTLSIQCESLNISAIELKVVQRSQVSIEFQEISVYDDSEGIDTTAFFTRDKHCRVKPVTIILSGIDFNTASSLKQLVQPYVEDLSVDYQNASPPVFECTINTMVKGSMNFNVVDGSNTKRAIASNTIEQTVLGQCTMTSFRYWSKEQELLIQVVPKYSHLVSAAVPCDENTITVRFSNEVYERLKLQGVDVFNEVYKALPFEDVTFEVSTALNH